jgi:pyruvate,orthophosphate dikinase
MATRKKKSSSRSSAKSASKLIYYFGKTRTEGSSKDKILLGGKGANLAEMTSIGLPVPAGFTVTTAVCDLYYKNGKKLPKGLMDDVRKNVATL